MADNTETFEGFSDEPIDQSVSDRPHPSRPSPIDDVEAQMRRALSALGPGGMLRAKPERERNDGGGGSRLQDRFNPNHRRKFVQDGEVPVAFVRRDQPRDTALAPPSPPSALAIRLQRAEADLAAQISARQQAERAAVDAQSALRDLRTKLGHVELARNEAVEALRREREQLAARRLAEQDNASLQQEHEDRIRALQKQLSAAQSDLTEERSARKSLEKELRAISDAKETAERLVRVLSEDDDTPSAPTRRASKAVEYQQADAAEPEPVKWWLPGSTTKRR